MAPERFRGQADPRSDLYGLGLTLYEMAALRPAFTASGRVELIEQILRDEPPRPRAVNPHVPRDLETIILKATAREPGQRYQSAAALAEDLRCFLDDRTIHARRATVRERAGRWYRRNRRVAVLLGLVAALVVTVAVGASLAAWRLSEGQKALRAQLGRTQQAEAEATGQLYRALVAQARASRLSRRQGQRFETLAVLAKATRMARDMGRPEKDFLELRNETMAALALPDVRIAREWKDWPEGSFSVDFDGTLEHYARTNRQGAVSVRRVDDDTETYPLPGMGPGECGPVFSPDGRFLAVWHEAHRFRLWKLARQEPVLLLEGPEDTFAFSPDSRQLARALPDGSLWLYDLHDLPAGRPIQQLPAGPPILGLAFHPRDRQLAVRQATGVQVHDLARGGVLARLAQPAGPWSRGLAWNPDGKTLAVVGDDRVIHIWDVAAAREVVRLEGDKGGGIGFGFNHAGDLRASRCWDGIFRLWDPRTGQELFATPAWLGAFRFSPDDRLLAVSNGTGEFTLGLWEVAPACAYRTLGRAPVLGRASYVSSAVHPDGRLLAAGAGDGIDLWDLASGNHLAALQLPFSAHHVLFDPSGALLTNGADGLRRWPIRAGPAPAGLVRVGPPEGLPLPGSDCGVAASRDGRVLASAQYDGGLVLHGDRPGQPAHLGPHADVRYIAVSPDGRLVATGSHNGTGVKVWQARDGKLERELPVEGPSRVGFSPDGKWLATGGGGCRLWAVEGWQEGPRVGGDAFAFSPDSTLLAVETGAGAVRLLDPSTGREYARLEGPNRDRAESISFTPDGTRLVTAIRYDSNSVHVWDLRAIRIDLAKRDLDWGLPAYPPAGPPEGLPPLLVEVDRGD